MVFARSGINLFSMSFIILSAERPCPLWICGYPCFRSRPIFSLMTGMVAGKNIKSNTRFAVSAPTITASGVGVEFGNVALDMAAGARFHCITPHEGVSSRALAHRGARLASKANARPLIISVHPERIR